MGARLRGWLALSGRERAQFLGLVLALPAVHGALAVFGYVRTRRALERISARASRHAADAAEYAAARRLAELAEIAGRRGLLTTTCLRQALLVYTLLRRRGLDPQLQLGVRKQGDAFGAHAWVELEQRPLAAEARDFVALK